MPVRRLRSLKEAERHAWLERHHPGLWRAIRAVLGLISLGDDARIQYRVSEACFDFGSSGSSSACFAES